MDKLKDMQRNFIQDCLSADFSQNNILMEGNLNTDKISAFGSMEIYRESAIGNLHSVLQLTYPVIEKLVGEDFFEFTCRNFISNYWPETGNMDEYGREFPEFIKNFGPAKELIYLSDTAKLEWLFQETSLSADAPTLEQEAIASVPPEKYYNLYLHIHPSVNFMTSDFPVNKIWEMNQENSDDIGEINLDESETAYLMLCRPFLKTNIIEITEAEMKFLTNLINGESLFQAYESATEINEQFDLSHILQKHLSLQNFSGFTVGMEK